MAKLPPQEMLQSAKCQNLLDWRLIPLRSLNSPSICKSFNICAGKGTPQVLHQMPLVVIRHVPNVHLQHILGADVLLHLSCRYSLWNNRYEPNEIAVGLIS